MSLSNKNRSQLTEEVGTLQYRKVKLKQFNYWLLLADEITQKSEQLFSNRFRGMFLLFPVTITPQLYPELIFRDLLNSRVPSGRIFSMINKKI